MTAAQTSLGGPGPLDFEPAPTRTTWQRMWPWYVAIAAVAVLGYFFPLMMGSNEQLLDVLGVGLVLGIAATGVGLLFRQIGFVNFGAGAVFGGGAYFYGILCTSFGMPMMLGALLALVLSIALSVIIGALTVRAGHLAFAIMSIAFSQMLLMLIGTQFARPWTGGADGLIIAQEGTFFGLTPRDLFQPGPFWMVAWSGAIVAVLVAFWLEHSRLGRIARAVQQNEERMKFAGYRTFWPKFYVYVICGTLGGLAGILHALHFSFASPDLLSVGQSGDIIVSALVGGAQSPIGPMLGALLFAFGQDRFGAGGQIDLFTGIGIILAVVLLRQGIAGLIASGYRWLVRRIRKGARDAQD
jgi:branched-chain amino acid transport system permease protein